MHNRDIFIDTVKGWGILLVIWGHSSLLLFNEIYTFHMPLFFFVSGCFFKWNETLISFAKKKFSQLLIPYGILFLFSCLLYFLILAISNRLDTDSWSIIKGIVPIDNKSINTPLWFLYALFWMSLIYYVIRQTLKRNSLILLICLGLHFLEYTLSANNIELPTYLNRSLRDAIYMHIGYWSYQTWTSSAILKLKTYQKVGLLVLFTLLFLLLFRMNMQLNGIIKDGINIFIALSGIISSYFLSSIFLLVKRVTCILSYLGTHTLCLFALHLPFFEFSKPLAKALWNTGNIRYDFTVFISSLLLSIIVGETLMLVFPKYLGKSSLISKK